MDEMRFGNLSSLGEMGRQREVTSQSVRERGETLEGNGIITLPDLEDQNPAYKPTSAGDHPPHLDHPHL